jgi:hypothetical protein
MDLRCRKTNCKFNKSLTCTAKSINISNKLECRQFVAGENKENKDFSSKIFSDNPPKVADYRDLKDVSLNCKATCLFNKNGHCLANGITVNAGTSREPKCITFLKP